MQRQKKENSPFLTKKKRTRPLDFIFVVCFIGLGTNLYTAIIITVNQKRENTKQQKSKAQIALNRTRGNRVTMCASKMTERHQKIRKMRKKSQEIVFRYISEALHSHVDVPPFLCASRRRFRRHGWTGRCRRGRRCGVRLCFRACWGGRTRRP